jgi:hypothetical protein
MVLLSLSLHFSSAAPSCHLACCCCCCLEAYQFGELQQLLHFQFCLYLRVTYFAAAAVSAAAAAVAAAAEAYQSGELQELLERIKNE